MAYKTSGKMDPYAANPAKQVELARRVRKGRPAHGEKMRDNVRKLQDLGRTSLDPPVVPSLHVLGIEFFTG